MSWLNKLKSGLSKSSKKFSDGLSSILHQKKLDDTTLMELEDLLIQSDVGAKTSLDIVDNLRKEKFDTSITVDEVKAFLAKEVERRLDPYTDHLNPGEVSQKPEVIFVVGINGSGKTTTIAKLGALWKEQGKNICFAAGDTFRAAAVEQLSIWGNRLSIPVVKRGENSDAASLVYEAIKEAQKTAIDVLLVDTAGRLHTNINLMQELEKVKRTANKAQTGAPHKVILVLDATIGQNAYEQVRVFEESIGVSGFIITKLDGTAKGGVLLGLTDKFKKPIYAIGIGERTDDLQPFDPHSFSQSLLGI